MDERNRELLSEVIHQRLETALEADIGSDEGRAAYEEAMKAIDRQTEISKLDASREEQALKEVNRAKEAKRDRVIKWVEIGVVAVAVPIAKELFKWGFAKLVMGFEKEDSFTTTPGKSTSGFFRF